jgi:hypothetical protein
MSLTWQLEKHRASIALDDRLRASIDLLRPSSGLELRAQGAQIKAMAVDLPELNSSDATTQLDAWVRDRDLVATYAETDKRRTRGQIYWRVQPHGPADSHAIELVVSVQTSLLDSDPALSVRTRASASEVLRLIDPQAHVAAPVDSREAEPASFCDPATPACFVLRLPVDGLSYVEMVHPTDFAETTIVRAQQNVELSNRLFHGRLEKGVILRSRLRALLVPTSDDVALASACYREFAASEPPLTT